jgi:tetratricopeptide (TPR) repeat protein
VEQAHYANAAAVFQTSINPIETLVAAAPANREYQQLVSEALGSHADALDYAGKLDLAIQQRERQLTLLAPYLAQDRPDADLRQKAMIANMHLSLLRFGRGETRTALDHAAAAVGIGKRLIELEPTNADWMGRSASTQLNQALLLLRSGRIAEARTATDEGCNKIDQLTGRDPTVASWRESSRRCVGLRAELALIAGSNEEAVTLARQALAAVQTERAESLNDRFALGHTHKLVGDILWRSGDRAGAIAAWRAGLAVWPKGISEKPRQTAERGEMLRGIGQRAEGMRIESQLAAMGYRQSLSNRARV